MNKMKKERSLKPFVFKGIAILLSASIILLSAELILRIYGPKYYRFNNTGQEYYTNPRGYHIPIGREGKHIIYGLNYKSDKQGYRLPDISNYENKQNKEYLILGLGDSFTFGAGVKYEDRYLTLLEKLLNQKGYKISIRNCGKSGGDIEEIINTYFYESSKKSYPLVLYGFVLNDFGLPEREKIIGADFIDQNDPDAPFDPIRKKSSLYNFIKYVIDRNRLHNITLTAYLEAFEGEYGETGFEMLRQFHRDIKNKDSKLVVILFPLLYNFNKYPFKKIHEKISDFCAKEDIFWLDLLPAFSRYRAESLWANPTDHHPNELAHRIAAGELYKLLDQNKLLLCIKESQAAEGDEN